MEWGKFDWFILGLLIGYLWFPIWNICKKVWSEAKIASREWNNPK
jgi:hypothetical protein